MQEPIMTIEPIYDPRATTVPVLRYLVALAEHRHFGRAAAAARISQPTLSAQIAAWERSLGVQVFVRDRAGVRPTPAGERIIAAARQALRAVEAVEGAAATALPPFFGPVRLGVIPTVGPYALPFLTRSLERAFPDLDLPIREDTTGNLLAGLEAGRVDVAVLALPAGPDDRFGHRALYHEDFVAAVPKGHRLAAAEVIAASELAGERLLLLDEGHCLRDQALSLCQRRKPTEGGADYRATSLETLRQLVAAGAGVTVLPALAVGEPDRRLVIRPLSDRAAGRTIGLVWLADDPRAAAYGQLAPAIRKALPAAVRPA
jgi:LysR family hydrogen peroxide-inducible transcriptional activator